MSFVVVKGAREHNLKSVDLPFPRDRLVCFTGVSGSGKSSLAYDTIYKEGQRRFLESLSSYARQFMGRIEKPRVDHVEGLSPTVAIDQKSTSRNPRSTVGTITEVWDFLRVLLARLGTPRCATCGEEVRAVAPEQIADEALGEGKPGETLLVLAPIVRGRKGSYRKELLDLTIDRSAATLSGGESQRIRLAAQVGSGLRGILYLLDEPSIGLHPRDNARLIATLRELRDRGNSVVIVEHDEETMRASDVLVDFGPGAGEQGGRIVAVGTPDEVCAVEASLTARYLHGEASIEVPARRGAASKLLEVKGASQHNLKDITVRIPLERLVGVSGVSGSGKSSLVHHLLRRALARPFHTEALRRVWELGGSRKAATLQAVQNRTGPTRCHHLARWAPIPTQRFLGFS